MRVPGRNSFEVISGGAQQRVSFSTPSRNPAAEQASQFGAALSRAGSDVAAIAQDQQRRLNEARVREASVQYREAVREAEAQYRQFQGAELVNGDKPVIAQMQEDLAALREELQTGLSNEDAQNAFADVSSGIYEGFSSRAFAYEQEQGEFYIQQQRDGVIVSALETSRTNPEMRVDSLATANAMLREKFTEQGYDGDRLDQLAQDAMNEFAAEQIETYLNDGETDSARAWLDDVDQYLSRSSYQAINEAVQAAESADRVLSLADDVFEVFPPSGFGRRAPVADIDAHLREVADGDLELLENLRNEVAYRVGLAESQAQNNYLDDYNQALTVATQSPGRLSGLPSYRRLDADHQNEIMASAQRMMRGEATQTDNLAYSHVWDLLANDQYGAARDYMLNNQGKFSSADWRSMYNRVMSADSTARGSTPASYNPTRTTTQMLQDVVRHAGLEDDDDAIADIRLQLDRRGAGYYEQHGQQPSEEWLEQTANELATQIKITRPGWWNNDTRGFLYEFGSGDSAYRIDGIPDQFVNATLSAFRLNQDSEVPEETLRQYYNAALRQWQAYGIDDPSPSEVRQMISEILVTQGFEPGTVPPPQARGLEAPDLASLINERDPSTLFVGPQDAN